MYRYPNIRLLVGAERAGIGYGIAGLGGYGVALLVLRFAGIFMDMDDPDDPANFGVSVAWFFCGASMLAVVLWGAIHFLEGPKVGQSPPTRPVVLCLWFQYGLSMYTDTVCVRTSWLGAVGYSTRTRVSE